MEDMLHLNPPCKPFSLANHLAISRNFVEIRIFFFFIFYNLYEVNLAYTRNYMSLDARKPVFGGFANNKGVDQPAHTGSLISAFVVRLMESIMSRHSTSEISMF